MRSKHIFLSFKPTNHLLHKEFSKIVLTNFGSLTWKPFLKPFKYINNYLNCNIRIGQALKSSSQLEVLP